MLSFVFCYYFCFTYSVTLPHYPGVWSWTAGTGMRRWTLSQSSPTGRPCALTSCSRMPSMPSGRLYYHSVKLFYRYMYNGVNSWLTLPQWHQLVKFDVLTLTNWEMTRAHLCSWVFLCVSLCWCVYNYRAYKTCLHHSILPSWFFGGEGGAQILKYTCHCAVGKYNSWREREREQSIKSSKF